MALYGKKLHIRKNGVVTDINLWTESGEAGTPALHIRDGVNLVHARLGEVTDGLASDLRVRKDGVVYAVLKNRWVTINIMQSANQTIIVTVNGVEHTSSIGIPYGSSFSVRVVAAAGFNPGSPSVLSGVATSDVTITASPATQSLAPGSVNGNGEYILMIPAGVTVIKFDCTPKDSVFYVGVKPNSTYRFCYEHPMNEVSEGLLIMVTRMPFGPSLVLREEDCEGDVTGSSPYDFILSWGSEINAHGPTNGSVA